MIQLPFKDRIEAGRLLAAELAGARLHRPLVFALPRGGVPVGYEIARELHVPLDVVVVRKIGVPWQPELAMGAIAGESFQMLDYETIRYLGVSQDEVQSAVERERAELRRREILFRGDRPTPDLRNRTAVVVDDGLATGSTMLVAIRYVHSLGAERIVVAVPVGSGDAVSRVKKEADLVVVLAVPHVFRAVGEWYSEFSQTSDAEVEELLRRNQAELNFSR